MTSPVPLHYSTHAAATFAFSAPVLAEGWANYDHFEDLLVRWLQRAVVFQLPDNGQLFENRDYRPELADLVRLPYPLMAIEFQADDTLFTPESGLTRADKRIALAFSPAALPADELALLCSLTRSTDWQTAHLDALGLMAIYAPNAPEHPLLAWGFAPGFLLWDPVLDKPLDSPGAPPDMPDWARARRLSEHSLPVGIYPLVARQHRLGLTNEMVRNSTLADSVDELGATWDLPCSRGKPRPSPVGVAREGQGRGWIAPLAQNPCR